jgi:hypothetical protein
MYVCMYVYSLVGVSVLLLWENNGLLTRWPRTRRWNPLSRSDLYRMRQWIGRFCNTVFFWFGNTGADAAIAILLPTLILNYFIYKLCSYVLKLNKWKHLLFMTFLKSPDSLTHTVQHMGETEFLKARYPPLSFNWLRKIYHCKALTFILLKQPKKKKKTAPNYVLSCTNENLFPFRQTPLNTRNFCGVLLRFTQERRSCV